MISRTDLTEALIFDQITGNFLWKRQPRPQTPAGSIAGWRNRDGYILIRLKRRLYMAHQLAWLFVHGEWPQQSIDHINGIRDDNRPDNLRLASTSQNLCNRGRQKNNTSGIKGITWHNRDQRWQAQIWYRRKRIHLGYFSDIEDAAKAYAVAAVKYHGEFARTA